MNTYTFFITSFIIILIPGAGVIYTISVGISKGKKASMIAAFSCTVGIVPHLCISIALSSLLVKMSSEAFTIMKLLGALYLLYLGAGMMLSKTKLKLENTKMEDRPISIVYRGILINLLNPKLTLFFFSFLPQYVNSYGMNYVIESLIYGLSFMILTLIVFIGYGILGGTAKKLIINSPKRINLLQKFFGIIFVIFAVQLTLSPF
ncbi:MAG: LysE family translocator [Clostridium sp.]|jgi:threonine/homoserine/homoserine lactone efflux protein|uniref:LysE family translocator n=1 Tax=Clostridium sp. TaxID=1506 RepID=UPI0025C49B23|nr:LysE family translocator [Clostridium sp.]MCH3965813.1 LysE family translocator [Clostridium sp.]MCI1716098.1 LysE family translocator [Clostridium sp.]MCI1800230.1 LysE family translocator [Clostridium sp.]MCI1814275.1 LysE family translocator [Clostridium sp.]MCI1871174.1 LysE family translocator [Clostridium sp.]